jgi:pyruvate/2-oxoacid:ferredoxin oxidoreductase alpha subunit
MAYVRMIRPFPTRRLGEVLHQVSGTMALIERLVSNAQVEPPRTADLWTDTLLHVIDELDLMHDLIEEAMPRLTQMIDEADRHYERSLSAVRALLSGVGDE